MTAAISLRPFARVWFCYFAAIGAFTLYAPLWFRDLGLRAGDRRHRLAAVVDARVRAVRLGLARRPQRRRARLMRLAGVLCVVFALALALCGRYGVAAVASAWRCCSSPTARSSR